MARKGRSSWILVGGAGVALVIGAVVGTRGKPAVAGLPILGYVDTLCEAIYDFDIDTVVASVRRTNRAVIVHEAVRFGGLGAEIAAQIQEQAFDYLDAPVPPER